MKWLRRLVWVGVVAVLANGLAVEVINRQAGHAIEMTVAECEATSGRCKLRVLYPFAAEALAGELSVDDAAHSEAANARRSLLRGLVEWAWGLVGLGAPLTVMGLLLCAGAERAYRGWFLLGALACALMFARLLVLGVFFLG